MNEPVTQPPDPASVAAGHELHDVRATSMLAFAAALAVLVALACAFLIWLFGWFEARAKRHDPVLSPLVQDQTPPDPQLEIKPSRNLAQQRAAENRLLHHYRWIDKEQGVVQIPVERAMDLVAKDGLPAPQPSTSATEGGQ